MGVKETLFKRVWWAQEVSYPDGEGNLKRVSLICGIALPVGRSRYSGALIQVGTAVGITNICKVAYPGRRLKAS